MGLFSTRDKIPAGYAAVDPKRVCGSVRFGLPRLAESLIFRAGCRNAVLPRPVRTVTHCQPAAVDYYSLTLTAETCPCVQTGSAPNTVPHGTCVSADWWRTAGQSAVSLGVGDWCQPWAGLFSRSIKGRLVGGGGCPVRTGSSMLCRDSAGSGRFCVAHASER